MLAAEHSRATPRAAAMFTKPAEGAVLLRCTGRRRVPSSTALQLVVRKKYLCRNRKAVLAKSGPL
jgi:hypothetical protein